ncbi:unnamed protein product [Coccothraustes coccothraustes]
MAVPGCAVPPLPPALLVPEPSSIAMETLGPPLHKADWFGSETMPVVPPLPGMPTHHCDLWADTRDASSRIPGTQATVIPGSIDGMQNPRSMVPCTLPQLLLRMGQPQGPISTRNFSNTCGENLSHFLFAEPRENATTVLLASRLNPVSVWQQVKRAAVTRGDFKGADKTDMPMPGG